MQKKNNEKRSVFHAVGTDKSVYGHSSDQDSGWKKITSGSVTKVVVANRIIYGLDLDMTVCKWTGRTWERITNPELDVTNFVINGKDIFGLGRKDMAVWKSTIDGAEWIRITKGSMVDLAVSDGYIYGVGRNRCVYKHPVLGLGDWEKLTPGSVTQVVVANNVIYGMGMNKNVYVFNGQSWQCIVSRSLTSFDILEGYIYGMGKDGIIYKYPVPSSWTQCTSEFPTSTEFEATLGRFPGMKSLL